MTYLLNFLPEIEEDVIASYLWYEEKTLGLGEEFLRMFYARAAELSYNALLYQKVYGDVRRCLLRRFPYAIYFKIEGNAIIVIGLFHCAGNPLTVKTQLLDRDTSRKP
ncbi:MAG: hypothetical protein PF503_05640 [Desulfobacula sp.]|jgi:hypothetical protein|nr:hypothetical protein [Desulfobacula sp.]